MVGDSKSCDNHYYQTHQINPNHHTHHAPNLQTKPALIFFTFSLFSGKYFALAKGSYSCPPETQQIKDQEECKQAANSGFLGSDVTIATSGFSTNSPKVQSYCFLATNGRVHFNMNQNSGHDGLTKSICERTRSGFSMIDNGRIHGICLYREDMIHMSQSQNFSGLLGRIGQKPKMPSCPIFNRIFFQL